MAYLTECRYPCKLDLIALWILDMGYEYLSLAMLIIIMIINSFTIQTYPS